MTQHMSGYPPPQESGAQSTTDVARDEAVGVGHQASHAGSEVAHTATDQAKEVTAEARKQAKDLLDQGLGQVRGQASNGQHRAAGQLRSLADELREMSDKADQSGMAGDLVRQVADKAQRVSSWLEDREPGDVLDEVHSFARRRPGMFLLGAAVAGVVTGRLTKGAVAAQSDSSNGSQHVDTYHPPPGTEAPSPGPDYGQHAAPGSEPGGHGDPGPGYAGPGYGFGYGDPGPGYGDPRPGYGDPGPGYDVPAPQPGPAYRAPVPPRDPALADPRDDEYGTGGSAYPPGQVRP